MGEFALEAADPAYGELSLPTSGFDPGPVFLPSLSIWMALWSRGSVNMSSSRIDRLARTVLLLNENAFMRFPPVMI